MCVASRFVSWQGAQVSFLLSEHLSLQPPGLSTCHVCGAPRPPAAVGNMGLWCLCWNKSLCRAAEGLCHPQITPEHGAESGLLSEFPPPHESPHFAVKASEGEGAPLYVSVMVVDLHL